MKVYNVSTTDPSLGKCLELKVRSEIQELVLRANAPASHILPHWYFLLNYTFSRKYTCVFYVISSSPISYHNIFLLHYFHFKMDISSSSTNFTFIQLCPSSIFHSSWISIDVMTSSISSLLYFLLVSVSSN